MQQEVGASRLDNIKQEKYKRKRLSLPSLLPVVELGSFASYGF